MENLMSELGAALAVPPADRKVELERLWSAIDPADHAARCIAAHYIADAQDDVDAEVEWDERSLTESINVSDSDLHAIHPTLSVAGFMPSLHLNLADGYRRQGKFDAASDRLATSREFAFALDAPGVAAEYIEMIRGGQDRVAEKIAARDASA